MLPGGFETPKQLLVDSDGEPVGTPTQTPKAGRDTAPLRRLAPLSSSSSQNKKAEGQELKPSVKKGSKMKRPAAAKAGQARKRPAASFGVSVPEQPLLQARVTTATAPKRSYVQAKSSPKGHFRLIAEFPATKHYNHRDLALQVRDKINDERLTFTSARAVKQTLVAEADSSTR